MDTDVVVIGAGITGMVAARELALARKRVVVVEAADHVGGLAAGFPFLGTWLEQAYHHLFRTDTDILALMDELGIGDAMEWHESSIANVYGGTQYPFVSPFDLLNFKPIPFVDRVRMAFVLLRLKREIHGERFAHLSAADWMKHACGERAYSVLWKPLLEGKFHDAAPTISMAWLWARLHVRAHSRRSLFEKERLGYIRGGFHTLTDALERELAARHVDVRLSSAVESVRPGADGRNVVRLQGGEELRTAAVLCTTPSHVADRLLSSVPADNTYRQHLRNTRYLGAVCLVFESSQSLSQYYWTNILDRSTPFLVFIQHTNLISSSRYDGRNVYYLGAYLPHEHEDFTQPADAVQKRWLDAVSTIFPQFDRTAVGEVHLFRLRNAQHIVDTHYVDRIPPYQTPMKGVYLANFAQIFPEDRGTNYAVREGKKVAALMRDFLT